MNHSNSETFLVSHLIHALVARPKRWLVPAALVSAVAVAYALFRPNTWEASQALIVRNEATISTVEGPGKFSQPDQMKTIQETILELARSRGVLSAALKEVGPPVGRAAKAWPSDRDIADLGEQTKLVPPKGAEFGKTEVFYLKVRDHGRDRAVALANAITRHLQASFQQLRDAKAQSMIHELGKAVELSADDLKEATARLARIETEVGSDLGELRILHDASTGESALRRTATEIRNELRQAHNDRATDQELLALLREAQMDPSRLLAAPNRLLESQPALRRFKDGLVDAGLHTANLQGRMASSHPLVLAAVEAQQQIHENINRELPVAIRGIEAELRLNADRVALLEKQLADVTGRLANLASLRASYSNLVAETQNRKMLLEKAQEKLADARTSQATANTASLIAPIDQPDIPADPLGPGRSFLALAGILAGLVTGFGVLFLSLSPAPAADAAPVPLPAQSHRNGTPRLAPDTTPLTLKNALIRLNTAGQSRF